MIQKYSLCFSFQQSSRVLKLKKQNSCTNDASLSFITSAAFFISEHLPLLRPPIQFEGEWPALKVFLQQPLQNKIYHPYTELWSDVIIKRICQGSTLLHQDTAYIDIELQQSDSHHLVGSKFFEEVQVDGSFTKFQKIRKVFKLEPAELPTKKMAIFTTHPDLPGYPFAPRLHMNALLLGLYFDNQQWSIYDLTAGHLPTVEQIMQLDGVIIPGSRLSVIDEHPIMHHALKNLQLAMEVNKRIKVFAVCFGHQLVSHYFNARVERRNRKAGLEEVVLNQQILNRFPFLSAVLQNRSSFLQCEHHQDYVIEVPNGFLLLGKSQSCQVESLLKEDGRILTTQFHTEFLLQYLKKFVERMRYFYSNNQLYKQMAEEQEMETTDREEQSIKDTKVWVKCIRQFFKQ